MRVLTRFLQVAFAAIAAMAALLVLFVPSSVSDLLERWRLLPNPERYTVLAFSTRPSPQKQFVVGRPLVFEFLLENKEGRAKRYAYRVTTRRPRGSLTMLDSRSVRVANGACLMSRVRAYPRHPGRLQITVEIVASGPAISYRATGVVSRAVNRRNLLLRQARPARVAVRRCRS